MKNTVTLPVKGGSSMNAYTSAPAGDGPFPAIILFQEAFGVNGYIKNVADRLAGEGYLVIAPELFHRTAPHGFVAPYGDFSVVMPHFQALTTDALADDAQACYEWLMVQPNVKTDKIGCIGFCLGGRVSFIANSTLKLAGAVSYYGGSMHTIADMAATLSAPLLMFWGGKDQHIKPEHVQTVVDALISNQKDYINVVISYADHAFACDERPSYNPEAAKEAWGMTMAFFKNKLG